jgi:BirA family biotin operon repressor/biotin-[acetyl-CoA-carboxylase] ligase
MPESARAAIASPLATPVTDLATACGGRSPPRLETAARVAGRMLAGLAEFSRAGFLPFAREWADFDSLRDAPVTVLRHDGQLHGVARGADAEGALRVELAGGQVERVHAGDVSLRRARPAGATAG